MNGKIDYTEFLAAATSKRQLASEKNLQMAFNMIDLDKDGQISKEEIMSMFQTSEKKDDALWKEIFEEVDKNRDGQISYDEFVGTMNQCIRSKN